MLILLLLTLGICQAEDPNTAENEKLVTGHVDDAGICKCSVILADAIFPVEKMERLAASSYNLSLGFQQEITKIHQYQKTVDGYLETLRSLTRKVESMQKGEVTFTDTDLEMLKKEITQLEALVLEIQSSMTVPTEKVEALYGEVNNISTMVNQLEMYDKNNVLEFRRKVASLQSLLEECKRDQLHPSAQVEFGSCARGGIANISKPLLVKLNGRGTWNTVGGWGKDSFLGSDQDQYWESVSGSPSYLNYIYLYPASNDFLMVKNYKEKYLSTNANGAGMIMYNNSLYYSCNSGSKMCIYNMDTDQLTSQALPNVAYNNRFPYSSTQNQDVDMAADEYGLWAIYTTEKDKGNLVISKLNGTALDLIETWTTSIYKPSVSNAFMACGVMYATRSLNAEKEEIFYTYDTNTGEEGRLSVLIEKVTEFVQSITYNANNHKLYVFSNAFETEYQVFFTPLPEVES